MQSPDNQTWGPALWSILHHCTERIGTIPFKNHRATEIRLWRGLLIQLRSSLPCLKCRKHYTDYCASHPLPEITKESVRRWLYDLHRVVNERTGHPNVLYEALEAMYSGPFAFKEVYDVIAKQAHIACQLRWTTLETTLGFLSLLKQFQGMYHLS